MCWLEKCSILLEMLTAARCNGSGSGSGSGPSDRLTVLCLVVGILKKQFSSAKWNKHQTPDWSHLSLCVCLQNDMKMLEIIRYTHLFLQKFCMGNQENQTLLHKNLNLFLNPGVHCFYNWSQKSTSCLFCSVNNVTLSSSKQHITLTKLWVNSAETLVLSSFPPPLCNATFMK